MRFPAAPGNYLPRTHAAPTAVLPLSPPLDFPTTGPRDPAANPEARRKGIRFRVCAGSFYCRMFTGRSRKAPEKPNWGGPKGSEADGSHRYSSRVLGGPRDGRDPCRRPPGPRRQHNLPRGAPFRRRVPRPRLRHRSPRARDGDREAPARAAHADPRSPLPLSLRSHRGPSALPAALRAQDDAPDPRGLPRRRDDEVGARATHRPALLPGPARGGARLDRVPRGRREALLDPRPRGEHAAAEPPGRLDRLPGGTRDAPDRLRHRPRARRPGGGPRARLVLGGSGPLDLRRDLRSVGVRATTQGMGSQHVVRGDRDRARG